MGDLELLARLQHHGAATRLLDFTRSVYVALWFTAREYPNAWGLLVGLDLTDTWRLVDPAVLRLAMGEVLAEAGDRLSVWHPSSLSPRLPAQSGFFLWGRAARHPWGSLGRPSRSEEEPTPISRHLPTFVCVAVSPALKASMDLQAQSMFGFSEATLFPDFDGFAYSQNAGRPWPG